MLTKKFQVVLRMENYVRLVTKIAVRYWKALPASAKSWIDYKDFVNEGMKFARFEIMPYYDIRRNTSFTTILTISLKRYYRMKLRDINRQKRQRGVEISLEDLEGVSKIPFKAPDITLSRISMQKLYLQASPELKKYLQVWFFNRNMPDRIRISAPFKRARREFLKLAPQFSISVHDCRNLLEDRKKRSLS